MNCTTPHRNRCTVKMGHGTSRHKCKKKWEPSIVSQTKKKASNAPAISTSSGKGLAKGARKEDLIFRRFTRERNQSFPDNLKQPSLIFNHQGLFRDLRDLDVVYDDINDHSGDPFPYGGVADLYDHQRPLDRANCLTHDPPITDFDIRQLNHDFRYHPHYHEAKVVMSQVNFDIAASFYEGFVPRNRLADSLSLYSSRNLWKEYRSHYLGQILLPDSFRTKRPEYQDAQLKCPQFETRDRGPNERQLQGQDPMFSLLSSRLLFSRRCKDSKIPMKKHGRHPASHGSSGDPVKPLPLTKINTLDALHARHRPKRPGKFVLDEVQYPNGRWPIRANRRDKYAGLSSRQQVLTDACQAEIGW